MWFLRLLLPIGGIWGILAVWMPRSILLSRETFDVYAHEDLLAGIAALYILLCAFMNLKQSFKLGLVLGQASLCYTLSEKFMPSMGWGFYAVLTVIAVAVLNIKQDPERLKSKVVAYFKLRQAGTVADVVQHTKMNSKQATEAIDTLLKEKMLEVLIEKKDFRLFKWTEDIQFAEGIESKELEVNV